jgi:hypothetical protein
LLFTLKNKSIKKANGNVLQVRGAKNVTVKRAEGLA